MVYYVVIKSYRTTPVLIVCGLYDFVLMVNILSLLVCYRIGFKICCCLNVYFPLGSVLVCVVMYRLSI